MARSLVIVESPAKASTLGKFLGRDFQVAACFGHVRGLDKKGIAVDRANGYEPNYRIVPGKERTVAELTRLAHKAESIYLAADPDREGEAICWHLAQVLAGPRLRFRRVAFHEITLRAVEEAFRTPREIDQRRVDAQQARRILDRLVGYSLSPLLWQKVAGGLSAGRVQSVALRIVCERERLIGAFVPDEHWTVRARLDAGTPPVFVATLTAIGEREAQLRTAAQARGVVGALAAAPISPASSRFKMATDASFVSGEYRNTTAEMVTIALTNM